MRFSQYTVLPGSINVFTKFVRFVLSKRFVYSNQLSTSVQTVPHTAGGAQLFMAWATDADRQSREGSLNYDPKGTIHALPHARYVLYDTDPDPKIEVLATAAYDNYTIRMDRTSYYIRYDAVYGPIGDILQDYIRMTIFNDSFIAPFVKPEVS